MYQLVYLSVSITQKVIPVQCFWEDIVLSSRQEACILVVIEIILTLGSRLAELMHAF